MGNTRREIIDAFIIVTKYLKELQSEVLEEMKPSNKDKRQRKFLKVNYHRPLTKIIPYLDSLGMEYYYSQILKGNKLTKWNKEQYWIWLLKIKH